jgi:hypothetical protein
LEALVDVEDLSSGKKFKVELFSGNVAGFKRDIEFLCFFVEEFGRLMNDSS